MANDEQLRAISFWTLGSLAGANWIMAGVMSLALALLGGLAWHLAPRLNALALGEAVAVHVGVAVGRLRWQAIACVALLSALAVAWCGSIGFVGLMAPHLARQLAGADLRAHAAQRDAGRRTAVGAGRHPGPQRGRAGRGAGGRVSALIGAPWFLWLLRGALRRLGTA